MKIENNIIRVSNVISGICYKKIANIERRALEMQEFNNTLFNCKIFYRYMK